MVRLVWHAERDVYVVNTPGSHVQRVPRVYRSREAALARVRELQDVLAV
jgi:hypothetical protein